jgi:hypothetical protein
MKKNKWLYGLSGIALAAALASCASKPDALKPVDAEVTKNDFQSGVETITRIQARRRPAYREGSSVQLYLDKGMLEHYAGDYAQSSQSLGEAGRLIQEAETRSITQNIASFIANDNTKDYEGEDYEDIYLNIFNALNYYHAGKIDDALVEIRILTESSGKLAQLEAKYQGNEDKFAEALEPVSKITAVPAIKMEETVPFTDSALARYMSALFYRGQGKEDDARIEYERITAAYTTSPAIYHGAPPSSLSGELDIPAGKARLNVIAFTGLSPIKQPERVPILPTAGNIIETSEAVHKRERNTAYLMPAQARAVLAAQLVTGPLFAILHSIYAPDIPAPLAGAYNFMLAPKLRLPVLAARPSVIDRVEARIEGGPTVGMELIEDMGAAVEQTFNAKFNLTLLKTAVRQMVKYTAGFIAAKAAADAAGGSDLAGVAALVTAQKAAEASETPDTRCARYLPSKALTGAVNLDPGEYTVVIEYYAGGKIISMERKNIRVQRGKLNLIEGVCLQ